MTTVLFIHSAGTQGPGEGSSRLLAALRPLLAEGLTLVAPAMPNPDAPEAGPWIAACREAIAAAQTPLILVGHSLGGSILLQALAQAGVPKGVYGAVTLSSPFWGAPDWAFDAFALPADASETLAALPRLIVMQGEADEVVAADHPDRYRAALPQAEIRRVPDADHEAEAAAPALAEAIAELAMT